MSEAPRIVRPNSRLDYKFLWDQWMPVGDSIATADFDITGGTLEDDSVAGTIVTAWVRVSADAPDGSLVVIRNDIVTAAGRQDSLTMILQVQRG
jgi:hypothetical protein